MIPTSSQVTYSDLLIQYQPKTIKTEEEYHKALTIVEGMMSRELTNAENELFELLVLLIETYEEENYPMKDSHPGTTLESLMYEFDVQPVSLTNIIGSIEFVEELIQGQREITLSQAESLAMFFNSLNPQLFLTARNFGKY